MFLGKIQLVTRACAWFLSVAGQITVAVKTTSYEFLLLYRPSFRSRFLFSAATAAQGSLNRKLRERRQTRKADNRDSSFSPSALRVSHGWWRVLRTWTLKALADLPRPVRLTCPPVLPPCESRL